MPKDQLCSDINHGLDSLQIIRHLFICIENDQGFQFRNHFISLCHIIFDSIIPQYQKHPNLQVYDIL